jgi:hypothetical protein
MIILIQREYNKGVYTNTMQPNGKMRQGGGKPCGLKKYGYSSISLATK